MIVIETLITNAGFDLLSRAIAGEQLIFTRAALGDSIKDGSPFEPTDSAVLPMNNLISAKMNLPIISVTADGKGTCVVKCALKNETLVEGFFIRELGLFAKIGDGEEKLYSYRNFGELIKFIPAGGGNELWHLSLNLTTTIAQAQNISAIISADNFFVTYEEFDEHIYSTAPHPNIPHYEPEIVTTPTIWATGNDNNLHPITINNISKIILGDDPDAIKRLASRVDQTEINIANLFIQLNAEKELGLDANLLIAEDFSGINSCTDTLNREVNHEVAGINSICLDDFDGILAGHYYTISDGVRSEFLQTKSIAKNDDLVEVIFMTNFTKTFDLSSTRIFRSTGNIMSGRLGGSAELVEKVFAFEDIWTGATSTAEKIISLSTKQSDAANFELEGDAGFTNDGYFTLA